MLNEVKTLQLKVNLKYANVTDDTKKSIGGWKALTG